MNRTKWLKARSRLGRPTRVPPLHEQAAMTSLWEVLLDRGGEWSAPKIQDFVLASRGLRDVLTQLEGED